MNITPESLTFLLTLIGFYFAYFQWIKTTREKRVHLLKVLKVQLDCLGPWIGFEGYGYGEELTLEQKFENANPFKLIYDTASEALINLNMLDSLASVDENIIGELNQLYYDLVRIKNIQNFRNLYIFGDINTSCELARKINEYVCNNKIKSMDEFVKIIKSEREKEMLERLLTYGKVLHCDIIGNKDKSARQHLEKLKNWTQKELIPKDDYVFIMFTFIVLFGVVFGLKITEYSSVFFWLAFVFVGSFINMSNGALGSTLFKIGYKKNT